MTGIPDKISEIERNIQEGEMMLIVLRRLPESEETLASIRRFEELVQKLEEYRDRYKSLEAMPANDLDSQIEALREKHGRIRTILDECANSTQENGESPSTLALTRSLEEEMSPISPGQTRSHNDLDPENNEAEQLIVSHKSQEEDLSPNTSDSDIDPSDWSVHYQAQTCQLSCMISQVERFEEMVLRLHDLVSGLDMAQTVGLIDDIALRFQEVKTSLLSLQKAYQGLYDHENVSGEFRAPQLKSLREFLITLGRQLEVTKECFFSIAGIVKKLLGEHPAEKDDDQPGEEVDSRNASRNEDNAESEAPPGVELNVPTESTTVRMEKQRSIEQTLVDLYRQRDDLLHQLAEVRTTTYDSISASEDKFSSIDHLLRSAAAETSHALQAAPADSVSNVDGDNDESALPILRRLQARKNHLEELRGELRAFHFPNGEEVEEAGGVVDVANQPSTSQLAPPPRPQTAPRSGARQSGVVANGGEEGIPVSPPLPRPLSEPPTVQQQCQFNRNGGQLQSTPSSATNESDGVAQRSEAVTFQEPEAMYVDNTERLYKRMREARIWREEHRQPDGSTAAHASSPTANGATRASGDKISTASNVSGGGGCGGGGAGVLRCTNSAIRGSQTVASADTASGMDATAMATWGGDSDGGDEEEEEDDEGAVGDSQRHEGVRYMEDVDTAASVASSSKSGRVNSKRFMAAISSCSGTAGGSTLRDNRLPSGLRNEGAREGGRDFDLMRPDQSGVSLPHLGHSPSPDRRSSARRGLPSSSATTKHRHIRPGRPDITINVESDEAEEFSLTKRMASRLAGLEFKVEQLNQTCQAMVTENARLNSTILMVLATLRQLALQPPLSLPVITAPPADWVFSSPQLPQPNYHHQQQQQPMRIHSDGISGISSVHSLLQAPLTPLRMATPIAGPSPIQPLQPQTLHRHVSPSLEMALEQVQMLTAQVMEQHSRVSSLQNELHFALQNQNHLHQQQLIYGTEVPQQQQPSSSDPPLSFEGRLQRLKVAQFDRAFRELFKEERQPCEAQQATTSFAMNAHNAAANRLPPTSTTWQQPQQGAFHFDATSCAPVTYFSPPKPRHE